MIGSTVAGIWNALSKIVIFGMPFNVALVSALAISTVLPFFLKFLSSGSGFIVSGSDGIRQAYSRISDDAKAKRDANLAKVASQSRKGAAMLRKQYKEDGN